MTTWTRHFTMHLNCRPEHHYSYEIRADGQPTGIVYTKVTRKSRVVSAVLSKGDDHYDCLAPDHTKANCTAWLEAHRGAIEDPSPVSS